MTTIAYARAILAVDTRRTYQTWENGKVVRTDFFLASKIRVTRLFAATGTGSTCIIQMCSLLPTLLWLRWIGWGVLPYGGNAGMVNKHHTVCVVWRHQRLWSVSLNTYQPDWCPWLVFVRAHTRVFSTHKRPKLTLVGGSGSDHVSCDDVEEHGAVNTVLMAAEHDPFTNRHITFFNTATWRLYHPEMVVQPSWWRFWVGLPSILADHEPSCLPEPS